MSATSGTAPSVSQAAHGVRFDWGVSGGRAVAEGADVAVVVDVLSFTTSVGIAVERGTVVLPYPLTGEDADVYAAQADATLAGPRDDPRPGWPTLSPSRLQSAEPASRLVLPSSNGSTVSFELASAATTLVAASLRNARAVADWLAREHDADETVVAVVAAGERWPDGTLRPALEDLWGAGAVLAALEEHDWPALSPEAAQAADAYRLIAGREASHLRACASGEELAAGGYADEIAIAAQVFSSATVPVLSDRGFVPVP